MPRKTVQAETEGVRRAVAAAGGYRGLARGLSLNPSACMRWKRVPAEWCRDIERLFGVPRAVLRPDLFNEGE